jgi:hypothetical protein
MEIYKSIKKNDYSNRIIEELNASVLTSTYNNTINAQVSDLYESKNSHNVVVAHNTCPPINSIFIKTIIVEF